MIRELCEQIGRQEKKIEARDAGFPPATLESSAEIAGADAASLRRAAKALGTEEAARPGRTLPPPPELVGSYRGELSFRIGDVTLIPNGWMDFTGYYRTTDVAAGWARTFNPSPITTWCRAGRASSA